MYLRFANIQQLHKHYVRTFAHYIYLILTKHTGRWLTCMLPVSTGRFSTINYHYVHWYYSKHHMIEKVVIHSSCEIENFVETHRCKLCLILWSRVLKILCPHWGHRSVTPLVTIVYLSGSTGWCYAVCARKPKNQFVRGTKSESCGSKCINQCIKRVL